MDKKYFHEFLKLAHIGDLVRIIYERESTEPSHEEETAYICQLTPERVFLQDSNPLLSGKFSLAHPVGYSTIFNYTFLRLQQRRLEGGLEKEVETEA